ncbi:rRNA N6-adenosine-methyltransferase ZCCHC4 [Diabrotica virgifera virgifera]|uniref:rRNA N(6)-adenosine-methyltransferase ZCCHC4 n=1 Tax=Diabrotica virgifera virgifera TaxID=50390 RepID=A0A6P7G911_DIAVI|nr:rRNA N6-adenosine-methyltransferase ZCCHC4 [Diabrotica virgifera virgifera]
MTKGGVQVIEKDIRNHPCCPHGPTILFSRKIEDETRRYFACSACRDRKQCNFLLWEDEKSKNKETFWATENQKFVKGINHRKMFLNLNEISSQDVSKRSFCSTCNMFCRDDEKHSTHKVVKGLTDLQLRHPSTILPALDDSKREAQYHFSETSVTVIMDIFKELGYRNVICIGTPRIHEYIQSNCDQMSSILLDIDKRFHNFFGPLQFCWYNMFNNHFFFKEAKDVFIDFLQSDGGKDMVIITDPPFGGRTELISATFKSINNQYQKLNQTQNTLPMFWIYPYYMEPQILNSLPDFSMLDFKVEYDNHQSFQNNSGGRKQGSPIRIFTNVKPSLIKLPSSDYKHCKICKRWVAKENKHCAACNSCTSKNGVTYVHCEECNRCVKPTWKHCKKCGRCAQVQHSCAKIEFVKECFNCKKSGHKKADCPLLTPTQGQKRKKSAEANRKKKKK